MEPILTPTQWLELPTDVRQRIAEVFGLRKSTGTEVVDNRVVSDGYTVENLQGVSVTTMQTYLKSKEKDFYTLFNTLVEGIYKELNGIPASAEVYDGEETEVGITEENVNPEGVPATGSVEPTLETNTNANAKTKKAKGTKSK